MSCTATSLELVNEREAARILSVAQGTLPVWRSRRQGPPYVKVGGAVRYKVSDLERDIAERTVSN